MESSRFPVHEEETNISTFRRRNKMLILVLVSLIISLTLILAALIIYLLRLDANNSQPSDHKPPINPALVAFCHVNSDAAACLATLNPVISRRFVLDPNQIFALSLQAAAADLQHSIASFTDSNKLVYQNCSDSLRGGLDRIRGPLAAMRVDPFVESKSEEEREEMMNRIVAAEEDVETCLDDLEKIGGGGVAAELVRVKAYLNGAGDFVIGYAEALQMFEADNGAEGRRIYENLFGFWLFGSQFLFVICLFYSLLRIKSTSKF